MSEFDKFLSDCVSDCVNAEQTFGGWRSDDSYDEEPDIPGPCPRCGSLAFAFIGENAVCAPCSTADDRARQLFQQAEAALLELRKIVAARGVTDGLRGDALALRFQAERLVFDVEHAW